MYFTYTQNNSGGSFTLPAKYVIVWAKNADEANDKAEEAGLYFDGCSSGFDCSCCGDRWYRSWEDGTKTPKIYDQPAKSYVDNWNQILGIPTVHIVYKSGKTFTSAH